MCRTYARPYLLRAVQVQRGHVPGHVGRVGEHKALRRCPTLAGALRRARAMAWDWGCRVEIWYGYAQDVHGPQLMLVIKPKGA